MSDDQPTHYDCSIPTAEEGRSNRAGVWRTLSQARFNRNEIAGSLGDLGIFLPFLVGMASRNGLDFASGLFFAGVFNVVTGLTFAIPMAVQPMKAIATVALTEGLTVQQILAAGAAVSFVILLLAITGLIDWLNRVIPKSVVRGLQLALGLSLMMQALQMIAGTSQWLAADSYVTGAISAVVVLLLFFSRKIPAALVLFGIGLALTVCIHPEIVRSLGIGFALPKWTPLSTSDFASAFPKAALPQIPLTTLNSIIAVCALSADLFPNRPAKPRRVALSVAMMNLVGCWFGAMPMCHGAGGLAGQYRFGARTNGSILFLGVAKILLAVFLGASLMSLCRAFPSSVLGVMLAFAGMELALVCRDQTSRTDSFAMLLTAATCLGLNNIAIGFVLGLAMAWCVRIGLFRVEEGQPTMPTQTENRSQGDIPSATHR
jgi:MFS superfamily sulfate permease-like transporter